jgi:hypothetical protein
MPKLQVVENERFLAVTRLPLFQSLLKLSPLVEALEELLVLDQRVKARHEFRDLLWRPIADMIQVLIVHVQHLRCITRLVKSVEVKCLLRLNDARQVY